MGLESTGMVVKQKILAEGIQNTTLLGGHTSSKVQPLNTRQMVVLASRQSYIASKQQTQ